MSDSFLKSWIVPHLAPVSMGLSRNNSGMCCPFLLHGIILAWKSNACVLCLLHLQVNSSLLSHWGNLFVIVVCLFVCLFLVYVLAICGCWNEWKLTYCWIHMYTFLLIENIFSIVELVYKLHSHLSICFSNLQHFLTKPCSYSCIVKAIKPTHSSLTHTHTHTHTHSHTHSHTSTNNLLIIWNMMCG